MFIEHVRVYGRHTHYINVDSAAPSNVERLREGDTRTGKTEVIWRKEAFLTKEGRKADETQHERTIDGAHYGGDTTTEKAAPQRYVVTRRHGAQARRSGVLTNGGAR